MKKNVNCLIFLILLIFAMLPINSIFMHYLHHNDNNYHLLNSQQQKNSKNCFYDKVEYDIGHSDTDLIDGLVSNKGNTKGKPIIEVKGPDFLFSLCSIIIKIDSNLIDLSQSYFVLGVVDNNNFTESKPKTFISSDTFKISNPGIYHLHLVDIIGHTYDSYLELGLENFILSFNNSYFDLDQLLYLANELNVICAVTLGLGNLIDFSKWLHIYKFYTDQILEKEISIYGKGFSITFKDLSSKYQDFLSRMFYTNGNNAYNFNKPKLDKLVDQIATTYLQDATIEAESIVNMHGYSIKEILGGKQLPQSKQEIDVYSNNESFSSWLQNQANAKYGVWALTIKIVSAMCFIVLLLIIFILISFIRYRKVYQPLVLKEIKIRQGDIKLSRYRKIIFNIYQFIKLNTKNNKYNFLNKCKLDSFFLVKELIKSNIDNIDYTKYDNIFYNKKESIWLPGEKFIKLFLSSNNINEYKKKIRNNYPNSHTNKFHRTILYDILSSFITKRSTANILASENKFDALTKIQLVKIRHFLTNQEWNYYFFALQNLMHHTLIKFLNWKNKGLNFNAYCKVLRRKLFSILNEEEQVTYYLEVIQTVNFYRNLLSKVAPVKRDKLQEWNQLHDKAKEDLAWRVYFSLVDFISFTNKYLVQN